MPTPKPDPDARRGRRPRPPTAAPTRGRGRSQGGRARPGPPGFSFELRLVGGEEGRRLEQQQTEAIVEVLAWLSTHPPATPTASSATDADTNPV
jgi:hypothetical protein